MDQTHEERLTWLYKMREAYELRVYFNEEKIAKGDSSVSVFFDLNEAKRGLKEYQEKIEDTESVKEQNRLLKIGFKRGQIFYEQSIELLEEIQEIELSDDAEQYRVVELRARLRSCLELAVKNGYIQADIFFLIAQWYDREGEKYKAFEYYTTSIKINEEYEKALEARSIISQIIREEHDIEQKFLLVEFCYEQDQRVLQAIRKKKKNNDTST